MAKAVVRRHSFELDGATVVASSLQASSIGLIIWNVKSFDMPITITNPLKFMSPTAPNKKDLP
jgi:hypothetical protein